MANPDRLQFRFPLEARQHRSLGNPIKHQTSTLESCWGSQITPRNVETTLTLHVQPQTAFPSSPTLAPADRPERNRVSLLRRRPA